MWATFIYPSPSAAALAIWAREVLSEGSLRAAPVSRLRLSAAAAGNVNAGRRCQLRVLRRSVRDRHRNPLRPAPGWHPPHALRWAPGADGACLPRSAARRLTRGSSGCHPLCPASAWGAGSAAGLVALSCSCLCLLVSSGALACRVTHRAAAPDPVSCAAAGYRLIFDCLKPTIDALLAAPALAQPPSPPALARGALNAAGAASAAVEPGAAPALSGSAAAGGVVPVTYYTRVQEDPAPQDAPLANRTLAIPACSRRPACSPQMARPTSLRRPGAGGGCGCCGGGGSSFTGAPGCSRRDHSLPGRATGCGRSQDGPAAGGSAAAAQRAGFANHSVCQQVASAAAVAAAAAQSACQAAHDREWRRLAVHTRSSHDQRPVFYHGSCNAASARAPSCRQARPAREGG